jgi:hypothetical protein
MNFDQKQYNLKTSLSLQNITLLWKYVESDVSTVGGSNSRPDIEISNEIDVSNAVNEVELRSYVQIRVMTLFKKG